MQKNKELEEAEARKIKEADRKIAELKKIEEENRRDRAQGVGDQGASRDQSEESRVETPSDRIPR